MKTSDRTPVREALRSGEERRGGGAVLVLAALALAVPCATSCHGQDEKVVYRHGGESISLTLLEDRVAYVLDEDATWEQLRDLLPPETVKVKEAWLDLDALDPEGFADRNRVLSEAAELQRRAPRLIEHSGLLLRRSDTSQPVLLTRELIVRFDPTSTRQQRRELLAAHDLVLVRPSRFDRDLQLLATAPQSDLDALEAVDALADEPLVLWSEPNFVHTAEPLSTDSYPDDPYFPKQWHHENTGQGGGTPDADIDTPQAWAFTRGSPDVVIAVLENGFDITHPDLAPNLWSDPEDPSVHGWDFEDDDATLLGAASDPGATGHGTAAAGCAAARGDNGQGVIGSCPECRLMGIRRPGPASYFDDSEAFRWAWHKGADVITNSWTYMDELPPPIAVAEAIHEAATEGRDGKGCVVLFAVRNEEIDVDAMQDMATLPDVIGVGSVTNTDERTLACGYGPCVALLGPSYRVKAPNKTQGTLAVTTTDQRGDPGYNDDPVLEPEKDEGWPPCEDIAGDTDYTACFGGTSAATPIVAGVAGLLLDLDPTLTAVQVRRLLQDTADKVQDSSAAYDDADGFSTAKTHGFGRVNAFEATRVVAPVAAGGRGGVDLFLRDNRLDWGNTEQPSWLTFEPTRGVLGHWQSGDVKVDVPPFAPGPMTAADFEDFASEDLLPGVPSKVYVRVRNRGPRPAHDVTVHLLWSPAGTALPPLPATIWSDLSLGLSAGSGPWTLVGSKTLPLLTYCGPSLAAEADGTPAAVVTFTLTPPALGSPKPASHVCLLALADATDDPLAPDAGGGSVPVGPLVAGDNNATFRNVRLRVPPPLVPLGEIVLVANPFNTPIETTFQLVADPGTTVQLKTPLGAGSPLVAAPLMAGDDGQAISPDVSLPPKALRVLHLVVTPGTGSGSGFELRQWRQDGDAPELLGGLDFTPSGAPGS